MKEYYAPVIREAVLAAIRSKSFTETEYGITITFNNGSQIRFGNLQNMSERFWTGLKCYYRTNKRKFLFFKDDTWQIFPWEYIMSKDESVSDELWAHMVNLSDRLRKKAVEISALRARETGAIFTKEIFG